MQRETHILKKKYSSVHLLRQKFFDADKDDLLYINNVLKYNILIC